MLSQVGHVDDMKSKINTVQDVLRHSSDWKHKALRSKDYSTYNQSSSAEKNEQLGGPINGASVMMRVPSPSLHPAAPQSPRSTCRDASSSLSCLPIMPLHEPTMPSPAPNIASRIPSMPYPEPGRPSSASSIPSNVASMLHAASGTLSSAPNIQLVEPGLLYVAESLHRDATGTPPPALMSRAAPVTPSPSSAPSSAAPNTLIVAVPRSEPHVAVSKQLALAGSAKRSLTPKLVMGLKKQCVDKTDANNSNNKKVKQGYKMSDKRSLHSPPTIRNSVRRKFYNEEDSSESSDSDDAVANSSHCVDDCSSSNTDSVPPTDSDS